MGSSAIQSLDEFKNVCAHYTTVENAIKILQSAELNRLGYKEAKAYCVDYEWGISKVDSDS